jgi:hypothetical protein
MNVEIKLEMPISCLGMNEKPLVTKKEKDVIKSPHDFKASSSGYR